MVEEIEKIKERNKWLVNALYGMYETMKYFEQHGDHPAFRSQLEKSFLETEGVLKKESGLMALVTDLTKYGDNKKREVVFKPFYSEVWTKPEERGLAYYGDWETVRDKITKQYEEWFNADRKTRGMTPIEKKIRGNHAEI